MSATEAETSKTRGRIRIEPGAKRVRAYLGGELVADTTRPALVWEVPYYPAYYFPLADVRAELLAEDGGVAHSPSRGDGRTLTVRAGGKEALRAAVRYPDSPIEELRDLIRLDWGSMDAWFEEDEQVFTHPRNPYTRVDILPSSRHVRVEVDGEESSMQVVSSAEANSREGRISSVSPVGAALMGRKVGDVITIVTPGGEIRYAVLEIS